MLAETEVGSVVVESEVVASEASAEVVAEAPADQATPPAQTTPVEPSGAVAGAVVGEAATPAPPASTAPQAQEEPTDPPPPPPEEPVVMHRQSQEQLAVLEEMTLALEGLADVDDAFRALMADHGLTPERLAAALVINQSAYAAVATRRQADAMANAASAAQRNAYRQCRTAVVALRQVARTVIRDEAGRIAVGLDEPLPGTMLTFAAATAESLDAAATEPYATLLATVGYDAERIASLQALLAAYNLLAVQHRAALKAAERATAARDGAVNEVRLVLRQLKAEVYALLRRYPFLSTPTGF